jgi:hypothetical protein
VEAIVPSKAQSGPRIPVIFLFAMDPRLLLLALVLAFAQAADMHYQTGGYQFHYFLFALVQWLIFLHLSFPPPLFSRQASGCHASALHSRFDFDQPDDARR